MPIESLNVSEPCLEGLRLSGITTVGEIVDFLELTWGGRAGTVSGTHKFMLHLPETVRQLKAIGCWPDDLEDINPD
jgi:hypothetical protein